MVRSARGVLAIGVFGAALIGALWLWRAANVSEPAAPPVPRPAEELSGSARAAPRSPRWEALRAPVPSGVSPVRAAPMVAAEPQHLLDPCTELARMAAPAGFEQVEAHGVTVAWPAAVPVTGPRDLPLRPLALAHLAAGLLEEAAQLTGTQRRAELLVVVYPTREELLASVKGPSWAGGLYDGAVRVPADLRGDLGVAMSTLRHEVMHAQLHAAVGCMPVWFNEGAAMYFAGTAPAREWIELLRAAPPLDLGLLEGPSLDERATPQVDRLYAQSLAMLLLAAERSGGGSSLAPAVLSLSDANRGSPREGREVWSRLAPRADHTAVLDALARRIFGAPPAELGGILDGPLCCHGLARGPELTCRSVPPRAGRPVWVDTSTTPNTTCRARW